MHKRMLREIIGYCRRQEQAGDCPISQEFTREQLEDAILELDAHIKRIEPQIETHKLPNDMLRAREGR